MSIQTRQTALQGEYVRLYCTFERDGRLCDPAAPPKISIADASYNEASSSSESELGESQSSDSNNAVGFGPFTAKQENWGVWYVDWLVPEDLPTGRWFDVWSFKWDGDVTTTKMFEINVHDANSVNQWSGLPIAIKISDYVYSLINDLTNDFLYEAQHIPIYWEQGYVGEDNHTINLAYGNWNPDFRPLVRLNNRIVSSGWTTDWNGHVIFDRVLTPEDQIFVTYKFAYFSPEEMLDFLMTGLYAMNATPPSSEYYNSLNGIPFPWTYGVMLYAALTGFQRLIFGLNFQERAIIFGESDELQQRAITTFAKLYADYDATWQEWAKNIKTRRLPQIAMYVSPEYTLPGGRSRWFRYLFKGS
jgi:hypothetical protein